MANVCLNKQADVNSTRTYVKPMSSLIIEQGNLLKGIDNKTV